MSHYARIVHYDLQEFDIPKDARVLDLGCGFGWDIHRLHNLGYTRVSGIEPDPYCVERCEARKHCQYWAFQQLH